MFLFSIDIKESFKDTILSKPSRDFLFRHKEIALSEQFIYDAKVEFEKRILSLISFKNVENNNFSSIHQYYNPFSWKLTLKPQLFS